MNGVQAFDECQLKQRTTPHQYQQTDSEDDAEKLDQYPDGNCDGSDKRRTPSIVADSKPLTDSTHLVMRRFRVWYSRHWQTATLGMAILLLGCYILFFNSPNTEVIADVNFDEADIERELDRAKKAVEIVTYRPENAKWIDSNVQAEPNAARALGIDAAHQRTWKYHKIWAWANAMINIHELFPDTPDVDAVLQALATAHIVNVDVLDVGEYESGTSEKWVLTLEGGQKAMMKIIWEEKGQMKGNAQCNYGFEIPTAEIAGFHLHKLLGFRNTPYVTGRRVDLRREVLPVASPSVVRQIQMKKGNRTCVTGNCYYCKEAITLCPEDGIVEASIVYWVPRKLKLYTYPPGYMPFSTPRMDEWRPAGFNNKSYCNKVREIDPYGNDRYYHDLFDFAVIDTLMYHYDSKHYLIYDKSSAHGLTVRLDHGRAFCAHDRDELDVFLAPITQCCTLRRETYWTLNTFRTGVLTKRLKLALDKDPIAPILEPDFYTALERRLVKINKMVEKCIKANGLNMVLVG